MTGLGLGTKTFLVSVLVSVPVRPKMSGTCRSRAVVEGGLGGLGAGRLELQWMPSTSHLAMSAIALSLKVPHTNSTMPTMTTMNTTKTTTSTTITSTTMTTTTTTTSTRQVVNCLAAGVPIVTPE